MNESLKTHESENGPCLYCGQTVTAFVGSVPLPPTEGRGEQRDDGDTGYINSDHHFVHYRRFCHDRLGVRFAKRQRELKILKLMQKTWVPGRNAEAS